MTGYYSLMIPGAKPAGIQKAVAPYDGSGVATVDTADTIAVDYVPNSAYSLIENHDAWLLTPKRIDMPRKAADLMGRR